MPVTLFDRSNPQRNRGAAKWFEKIRNDYMALEPGHPKMPIDGTDPIRTAAMRRAAGAHEVKLPERGLAQLCKNCRKATRDSLWVVRCGPCGELFGPLLTLFNACDSCGGPALALGQLAEHLERAHGMGLLLPVQET